MSRPRAMELRPLKDGGSNTDSSDNHKSKAEISSTEAYSRDHQEDSSTLRVSRTPSSCRVHLLTSHQRLFSSTQLLAFALTFMSSWEVVAMNMGATFYNGGPQALAWGILLVVAGALALSMSMAELASIQPIAGAQYH